MEKQNNTKIKDFEQEFRQLMKTYLEIKRESVEIGFNETSFVFKDFLNAYISNNNKNFK